MAVLKKFNLMGQEVGEITLSEDLLDSSANSQMVKDYIIALRANARQWSANTKTRAEVNHSGQKPHPQKGTGRARQGYLGSPHYRGGGRVGGPRPKFDQHVHVNKKERRAAIQRLLVEKIQNQTLHVIAYEPMQAPRTKTVVQFLQAVGFKGRRILFLGEASAQPGESSAERYEVLVKSMRNVPRVDFILCPNVNGYDLAVSHGVVVMESALNELMTLLGA